MPRLPKEVVARAKAAALPAQPERTREAQPTVHPERSRGAHKVAAPDPGEKVRAKVVAHLKRLHPMD